MKMILYKLKSNVNSTKFTKCYILKLKNLSVLHLLKGYQQVFLLERKHVSKDIEESHPQVTVNLFLGRICSKL